MPTLNSDLLKKIQSLSDDTQTRVRQTVTMAKERPAEGHDTWNAHLAAIGLLPMTAVQIGALIQTGANIKSGALPIELRQVLQKIKDNAELEIGKLTAELETLEADDEFDADPPRESLERLNDFLRDMVDKEVRDYIQSTKPATGLKGIFANAATTTPKYFEHAAKAGVKTLKCPTCGAPRPADQSLETCAFCGSQLL